MIRLLTVLLVLGSVATGASAHPARPGVAGFSANDGMVFLIICTFVVLFTVGWNRMPRRRSGEPPVAAWRGALFIGGMALLAAVLLPPFDELADRYFSAHMAQHLVLLVVAPPMLSAFRSSLTHVPGVRHGRSPDEACTRDFDGLQE